MLGRPARRLIDEHDRALDDIEAEMEEIRENQVDRWFDKVLTKRIVVHTNGDQSIRGSLVALMDDGLILRAAELLGTENRHTTMAGEVFIPRGNVAFAQLDE